MASGPRHGRIEEFERVALPHMDALYNLAVHLARDRTVAEDLVQEAYLRAFRFFDTYAPGTNVRAWLFRILRNTFINRYRSERARPETVAFDRIEPVLDRAVDASAAHGSRPPDPETFVLEGVVDHEIREAIADLREEYRTVAVLALVEDLSYREIARVLSIPVGTVMSRLHRARRHLKTRLADLAARRGIVRPGEPVE